MMKALLQLNSFCGWLPRFAVSFAAHCRQPLIMADGKTPCHSGLPDNGLSHTEAAYIFHLTWKIVFQTINESVKSILRRRLKNKSGFSTKYIE